MDIRVLRTPVNGSGVGQVGTRRLWSFHLIAGLSVDRFTLGGMILCSKIERTLDREARKAVISVWLNDDLDQHGLTGE